MTPFNPITGAALPVAQVQQQLATDKTRQVRRQQAAQRHIAAATDAFEHTVENADAISPVHDEQRHDPQDRRQNGRRQKRADQDAPDGEPPHIDVVG